MVRNTSDLHLSNFVLKWSVVGAVTTSNGSRFQKVIWMENAAFHWFSWNFWWNSFRSCPLSPHLCAKLKRRSRGGGAVVKAFGATARKGSVAADGSYKEDHENLAPTELPTSALVPNTECHKPGMKTMSGCHTRTQVERAICLERKISRVILARECLMRQKLSFFVFV